MTMNARFIVIGGKLTLSDDFDNEAASLAKLVRKLTHAYSLPADSQAIELHKSGIVQLDRDAAPESVEIVGFAIGWHGHRHDRAGGQIKGNCNRMDCSENIARLLFGRRREVIGGCPLVRGAQLVDMRERQDDMRRPARELRPRPDAKVI